ncbi:MULTISPECIES: recombinase family protein [Rhodococcus]|uniref:recombinase family protein n=1 Tax=Rhodococcus TaxID=1827 RepID=UPI00193C0057|nr:MULTISPECIES: recombinase family protein [Rhodococcus]QRI79257.1 recombinase family protein [Rhodococcus aetherivorans]QSE62442.1 recombinase family protein [Rhodococcus sp. PSBB066]
MELGYARVSTTKQDLERQIDALTTAGVDPARIYVDKKSGATTDRPGLTALIRYAREGDVIVVHTLDRLGRTVRDTLNLIHDLHERGVGVRNLADPIRIDSSDPDDPMAQLAVVLLALFGQMERTYSLERAAHARAVATAKGRRIGRPSVVSEAQLAYATALRDAGATVAEIVAKTKLTRSTLYRHLPPRSADPLTAAAAAPPASAPAPTVTAVSDTDRPEDRLECPTCGYRPSTRREMIPHLDDLDTVWLHIDSDGQVREQRHCAQCQPHGVEIVEVGCWRCGAGPLVTGLVDEQLPSAVVRWLEQRGWDTAADLVCGNHG